jgi:hypothetical protein
MNDIYVWLFGQSKSFRITFYDADKWSAGLVILFLEGCKRKTAKTCLSGWILNKSEVLILLRFACGQYKWVQRSKLWSRLEGSLSSRAALVKTPAVLSCGATRVLGALAGERTVSWGQVCVEGEKRRRLGKGFNRFRGELRHFHVRRKPVV